MWNKMALGQQITKFFNKLFSPDGFPARWHCGQWTEFYGWFYISSDLAIWSAYMVIPYFLMRFLIQKKGIPMPNLLWYFSGFILLCGLTHLMDAAIFWLPVYRLHGLVKFFTAVFSWATIIALFRYFPLLMELKTGKEFNAELQQKIEIQEELQKSNANLAQEIEVRKKIEIELNEAREIAEESNQLKNSFLANMSHEIRTPMNSIIGFTELLQKVNLGKRQYEFVKTIKSSTDSLLTIINDILDLSKIEAGMINFEEKPLSIESVLNSVKAILAQKAKEKNIELTFVCDNDVPKFLLGDSNRIAQIIMNLTSNAIKFTNEGSVQVQVKVFTFKAEQCSILFTFKDAGIGISESMMEPVFDRFRQAEEHTERRYSDTGLGLCIVKQLVELQGGTISVKSIFNEGSLFSVTIPFRKVDRNTFTLPLGIEENFQQKDLINLKILLVEDNIVNVKFALALFSLNNLNADVVYNGKEAVEKVRNNSYDIILMDIEMPEMNGYEATSIIRRDLKSNIPILAISAHAMADERDKCMLVGMNDYLPKPININALFEKMYRLTIGTTLNAKDEKINTALCDMHFITENFGNNKQLIVEIIDVFLQHVPHNLNSINSALKENNYQDFRAFAHKIRSAVAMFGIPELEHLLNEMEAQSVNDINTEKIKELNHHLNLMLRQLFEELERYDINLGS
jgi:signal transduction histidine kinase/FixJ family two-component response regulator